MPRELHQVNGQTGTQKPSEIKNRSKAIPNMAEFFGCDDFDIFDEKESAAGYIAGTTHASLLQQMIIEQYGDRSKAFREGVASAIREQL